MSKPKAKVRTQRDDDLLRWVGRGGIASIAQLHQQFWPQAKEQTCRDRLLQLEKASWLKSEYTDTRKHGTPELVFYLTRQGANLFTAGERERMIIGKPASHELKQQLMMQDTRIMLERRLAEDGARILDFRNERELRSQFYKKANRQRRSSISQLLSGRSDDMADCQALIERSDGSQVMVDIEIDGQYYGQMLKDKVAALARNSNPVLYVAEIGRVRTVGAAIAAYPNIELMTLGS